MTQEALKLALEALQKNVHELIAENKLLKKALASPAQESDKYVMDIECTKCGAKQSGVLTVNTTPPQRTWVGLTDEEKDKLDAEYGDDTLAHLDAIEAKLKQKNGYAKENT